MKNIIIGAFAILITTALIVKAEAAALTVYNTSTNATINAADAAAIASTPLTGIAGGVAKTITVQANIPSSLAVSLSNSEIAWTLNKAGDYKASAIDIGLTSTVNSNVSMTVAGAADLVNTANSAKKITTYYALVADSSKPTTSNFVTASSFNTSTKSIAVSNGAGSAHLWNRLKVEEGLPSGSYKDDFTVTFSQNI